MKRYGSSISVRQVVSAAFLGFALTVLPAAIPAHAADNESSEPELLDTKILQHIMKGLGLKRDEDGIDYRERSPLVLPATKELPKPEQPTPASKVAGWPDDPDVKRVKQRRDIEKNRKAYVEGVDDRPLLPSQYSLPGGGSGSGGGTSGKSAEESAMPSSMKELGAKNIFSKVFGKDTDQYQTFTNEPPRSSLIEPPKGYRTPSPNQPFGVGKETWVAPKVDRQDPVR